MKSICFDCLHCKVKYNSDGKVFCDQGVWIGIIPQDHPFVTFDRNCPVFDSMNEEE